MQLTWPLGYCSFYFRGAPNLCLRSFSVVDLEFNLVEFLFI